MKNIILSLILFILCPASFSQTTAYTEDGEEIILYDNFTWKYANSNDMHHDHLNNGTNKNFQGIRKIDVYSDGNLRIAFWINNHRMTFYDGKISFNDMQPSRIEYYDFAFSKKNNGKIKEMKL